MKLDGLSGDRRKVDCYSIGLFFILSHKSLYLYSGPTLRPHGLLASPWGAKQYALKIEEKVALTSLPLHGGWLEVAD